MEMEITRDLGELCPDTSVGMLEWQSIGSIRIKLII
jgi:hypothetical protein